MSRIADNADYLAAQISFLKEGTELIDPSASPGRVYYKQTFDFRSCRKSSKKGGK